MCGNQKFARSQLKPPIPQAAESMLRTLVTVLSVAALIECVASAQAGSRLIEAGGVFSGTDQPFTQLHYHQKLTRVAIDEPLGQGDLKLIQCCAYEAHGSVLNGGNTLCGCSLHRHFIDSEVDSRYYSTWNVQTAMGMRLRGGDVKPASLGLSPRMGLSAL